MTKVKICGITREEDARFAADAGADFLGFVFASGSPRYVTPGRAAAIAGSVRSAGTPARLVGVFRNEEPEIVRAVAHYVGLDLVQLHGEEGEDDIRAAGLPVIKALRVGAPVPRADRTAGADWLLFDTIDPMLAGGTGRTFDWSLLAAVDRARPFFLAGGLTPDNVAAAIAAVRPDAIDVSSGVESAPGVKDHERVRRLMENVKR